MAMRRFYQAGHHMAEKSPSVLSPFAQHRCYRRWGDVCHLLGRRYPSFIAPTGSCATPVGLSPPSAFNLGKESLQVVRSPCCPRELPDVISESPSLDAGSRSPALLRDRRLVFRGCKYFVLFRPPSLLTPQIVPTAANT